MAVLLRVEDGVVMASKVQEHVPLSGAGKLRRVGAPQSNLARASHVSSLVLNSLGSKT
jgi:hypothetical protein